MQWIAALILLPSLSMAGLKFPSDRLKVMDIETLQRIVAMNLNKAQAAAKRGTRGEAFTKDGEPITRLTKEEGALLIQESLELIFARPGQNRATSAIYSNVEGVAIEYGGIYGFLKKITKEALRSLDKSGKDKSLLTDQNTYIYILNNMMGEIKPLALSEEGSKFRKLIVKIRDEDIDFSDSLKSYRILNSMSQMANPSKLAATIVGEKKCSWWEFLWC